MSEHNDLIARLVEAQRDNDEYGEDIIRAASVIRALSAQVEELRDGLEQANAAIAEYYRYWTGGETRGSYDGKPERAGLWKAMYDTRTLLAKHKETGA